jgi:hypothetical protein
MMVATARSWPSLIWLKRVVLLPLVASVTGVVAAGLAALIVSVTDIGETVGYGLMPKPGLALDDKVVPIGKGLATGEIRQLR